MHPFVVFGIILVIIWTLSAAASAANRKQERLRRERLRQQMMRAGVSPMNAPRPVAVVPPQQRRISPGIASRFPDVLLPPRPAAAPQRRPQPIKAPARAAQQQRPARIPKPAPRRQGIAATSPPLAPPPLAQAAPTVTHVAPVTGARAVQPARQASSASGGGRAKADARALARWLRPQTLQQQFIVTEIFQPPLALRSDSR